MDIEGKKETARPRAADWALRICRRCGERHGTRKEMAAFGEVRAFFYRLHDSSPILAMRAR